MILFTKCLLLFRLFIVVLVVAPWQGVDLVWCTIVVPFWCLSPHVVVMVWLTNVEMVLANLSCKQNCYGNIVVTVAS